MVHIYTRKYHQENMSTSPAELRRGACLRAVLCKAAQALSLSDLGAVVFKSTSSHGEDIIIIQA